MTSETLLSVRSLTKSFSLKGFSSFGRPRPRFRAVDDVSFDLLKGETLGVVGESGCGKSTLSRLIVSLMQPDDGAIVFEGQKVGHGGWPLKEYRRQVQIVFQDSYSSLNPRLTVAESIAFAPRIHGASKSASMSAARDLLDRVGLGPDQFAGRYPHELSGGQRQRINIARALVLRPKLIVLDEPVSALDKSVEAQVLNLLKDLKSDFDVTYLFISHDLNVVQYMADRLLVMYLGAISEFGPVQSVYATPAHPYPAALFASRPSLSPEKRHVAPPLTGDPPSLINPPSGCRFRSRCATAEPVCAESHPPLFPLGDGHAASCFMVGPGSGHSRAPAIGTTTVPDTGARH